MNTYTIYINNKAIATASGTEYCYEVYTKAKELAELTCQTASIVWDETGEVVANYDPEEE